MKIQVIDNSNGFGYWPLMSTMDLVNRKAELNRQIAALQAQNLALKQKKQKLKKELAKSKEINLSLEEANFWMKLEMMNMEAALKFFANSTETFPDSEEEVVEETFDTYFEDSEEIDEETFEESKECVEESKETETRWTFWF